MEPLALSVDTPVGSTHPTVIPLPRLVKFTQDEFRRNRFNFLMIEASTGLTFCGIALSAPDDQVKRSRNTRQARIAYDTIVRFRGNLDLTKNEDSELDAQLDQLRANLTRLGEVL